MTLPALSSVAALYCLQNSMVCTPWGPSAVPTGGAGVALPAGSWIFTTATTRLLAIANLSQPATTGDTQADENTPSVSWSRTRNCSGLVTISASGGLELRHLGELELDRRLPAEDVDEHLELELVLVD